MLPRRGLRQQELGYRLEVPGNQHELLEGVEGSHVLWETYTTVGSLGVPAPCAAARLLPGVQPLSVCHSALAPRL